MSLWGTPQRFQAIRYRLETSTPIALQGTLFGWDTLSPNPICDPSNGTDNLNDFGDPSGTGDQLVGFVNHPDRPYSSAIFWFGDRSSVSTLNSGCIDYSKAPDCP